MSTAYKPPDYSTVSLCLIVDGAASTIAFLKQVLDAVELRRFADETGRLVHAEVRIGHRSDDCRSGAAARLRHRRTCRYVPDVDETYNRALEAGAVLVQEPVRKENGGVAWGFGPGLYPLPDSEARSKRMMEMEEV